jgi:hypothetical protein
LIDARLADAPQVSRRLVWIAVAVMSGLSLLVVVATGVMWLVYRQRRAELDAAGAEIVGKFKARMAVQRREDPQWTPPGPLPGEPAAHRRPRSYGPVVAGKAGHMTGEPHRLAVRPEGLALLV